MREGIATAQPPEATRALTARHQPTSEALASQIYRTWRSRWR